MSNQSIATSVASFSFEEFSIRVINRNGEIWFVAADVGAVLGLANIRYNLQQLDDDEKGVSLTDTPSASRKCLSSTNPVCMPLFSEAGSPKRNVSGNGSRPKYYQQSEKPAPTR